MSGDVCKSRSRFEEDAPLLRQYTQDGSQAAFAALMRRHLPFVYATCRREIGNEDLAQDAAQVVFLLLARKAKSLRDGTALAAWLFQTARFTARDIAKQERRRMIREQSALENNDSSSQDDLLWRRLDPLLNDALGALNRGEREAILLRYFEERSLRETGDLLSMTKTPRGCV